MNSDKDEACKTLLESWDSLLVHVDMVVDLTVGHVSGSTLDSEVDLVSPHVPSGVLHGVVRPAGVQMSIEVLVVLDIKKTLLQNGRVKKRVETVTGDIQGVDLSGDNT